MHLPISLVQYYIMAAKDKVCGNPDLPDLDLLAWVEKPSLAEVADPKYCAPKEQKWIGAPDKTDDLVDNWGRDPCADAPPFAAFIMPFIWYFVFYMGLYSYLIFNIWSLKEELAAGPKSDTEMGAAKPAVAVAVAALECRGERRPDGAAAARGDGRPVPRAW